MNIKEFFNIPVFLFSINEADADFGMTVVPILTK